MATKTSLLGLTKPAYTDAADIAVLNTNFDLIDKAMGQGARVQNLLDNSWFGIPIAQAGQNGFHGSTKYVCDRWISRNADATFANGCITPGSPIDQHIDLNMVSLDKTYTVAFCLSDGTIKTSSGTPRNGVGSYNFGMHAIAEASYVRVRLMTDFVIRWAAFYEGAYTPETLPAYVYKGYAAELAECQRYYYRIKAYWKWLSAGICTNATTAIIPIHLPAAMRVAPTVTMPDKSLIKVRCGATPSQAPTATTWEDASALHDYVQLTATVSGATNGDIAMLYFDNGGVIEFSADL